MTKKRRSPRSHASSRKGKRQGGKIASLAIPITVGLVVVAVLFGIIVSAENRLPSSEGPSTVNTAQGLDTQSIPYPDVPRIPLADAQNELQNGQAILIDVRSTASYNSEHAVGAISMPEEEVNARLNELPRDKDIILYCT
jgi:hypothetical protein